MTNSKPNFKKNVMYRDYKMGYNLKRNNIADRVPTK